MASILLIDDDESVRNTIEAILARAGHDVLTASNGKEGIALLQSRQIDLIITDILMPEQEGLETIMEIRRLDPQAKIIAISGSSARVGADFLEVARKFGALHAVPKPFRAAALLELVDLSLGGAARPRASS